MPAVVAVVPKEKRALYYYKRDCPNKASTNVVANLVDEQFLVVVLALSGMNRFSVVGKCRLGFAKTLPFE
jgi:hypothetical protein